MSTEPLTHYICTPAGERPVGVPVAFLPVHEFLADEPACRALWELVSTQFRTRGKFLAIWPSVRFVAVYRTPDGRPDGLLLVSAPVNWQIDYVVVGPDSRGRGVGTALVTAAVNEAGRRNVPYVMLSSTPAVGRLYEACGFRPAAGSPSPGPG